MSSTTTLTHEETRRQTEQFLDQGVKEEVQKALKESTPFWKGIELFIEWIRGKVKTFFCSHLEKLPIVGKWASRIGTTTTEFFFTVLSTMLHFLKIVFSSPKTWMKAHEAAIQSWNDNTSNGLLAQTYAYSKKMAAYFLEIIMQCFERAVKAAGLEVSESERKDISDFLTTELGI